MAKLQLKLEGLELENGLSEVAEFDLLEMRNKPIRWDKVTKVTHQLNCGWQIACSFNCYAWKGVVLREEQAANYPPPNDPDCPDINPRGCQKGVCWSHVMYSPVRIKHPYKRVGERGEGKWERISWDQAFTEITDKMLDIMTTAGPKAIVYPAGGGGSFGGRSPWAVLGQYAGVITEMINCDYGDDQQGALETFGNSAFGDSCDNWWYADMIIMFVANPSYTQIPWYHYLTEARYNGTKVVIISPDYNPSALAADQWISVKPGGDAALGLAMSQVIIEEGLYKRGFVQEQTDLPLLVRMDNRKFLRESDLKRDGRSYVFCMYDTKTGKVTEAPHTTLALGDLDPALEGEYEVETLSGRVKVRPAFALLKERVNRDYTPEQASEMCGVHPQVIRDFAREFAKAKGVVNIGSYGIGKFYHGNLMERGMIYNWALCGHLGRRGASYRAESFGFTAQSARGAESRIEAMLQASVNHPRYPEWKERNFSDYRIVKEMFFDNYYSFAQQSAQLWWFHAGLLDLSKEHNSWDPHLKRPVAEYVEETLESGKRSVWPKLGKDPKGFFVWGGDPMRRVRMNQLLTSTFFPKLDLFVAVDIRWSGCARYADYVLPVCGYYERIGAGLGSGFWLPIAHFNFQAVEPLYESKSDYWIGVKLIRRLAERARDRGITTIKDPDTGVEYRVDNLDAVATANDIYTEDDGEAAARDLYGNATNLEQLPWEELQERGWAHVTSPGTVASMGGADLATKEIEIGEPVIPLQRHVVDKEHYITLTGRIQFYIDEDWHLELGEEFAAHKDSLKAGGDYPLQMTGGHARWSIHTTWVENGLMLQLQRGEPLMFMNDQDAEARGIEDGDQVEVFNDVGTSQLMAAISPMVRPGQVIIYHPWTNAQFKDWRHFQHVTPSPFNPIEFTPVTRAEYVNLTPEGWAGEPGCNDRDTRVEARKVLG